ncbi:MAG: hypothetical protein HY893_03080 [Deltaproteobacteria bacterium]|nr:hypothetical protein [Deltaproteobacteria bacterium]
MNNPQNNPGEKARTRTLFALTLAFVFSLSFLKIYDYDVWFHLKTGEYILQTLTIPRADVFSYTAYGHPWVTHEWLFEVFLQLVYSIGGVNGLIVMKVLFAAAVFGTLFVFLRKRGVSPFIITPVLIAAAILSRERYLERPELLTYLFTVVWLFILEGYRQGRLKGKYLWAMPVLMPVWANSHSGAIFGITIMGVYTFGIFADGFIGRGRGEKDGKNRALPVLVVTAAALLTGLLNPNTFHAYTYPFTALGVIRETGISIAEFTPPNWEGYRFFFICLAVSAVVIAVNFRKAPLAQTFLFLLFSLSALRFRRNIAVWAIITAPVLSLCVEDILSGFKKRPGRPSYLLALQAAGIAALAAFYISSTVGSGLWGFGLRDYWFPEKAVQFMDKAGISGNMYNTYELGGYLLWRTYPERKVYIDGRADIYTEVISREGMLGSQGFENIADHYGINYAVINLRKRNAEYVRSDPYFTAGMALVHWDDLAMVFLKRTPQNSGIIERYEYRYAKPYEELKPKDRAELDGIISELERNVKEDPSGRQNRRLLEAAYRLRGN